MTGAGRNIGRAIVLEFAQRGANVVINARSNRDEAEAVAKAARDLGVRSLVVMGDASDPSTVEEMRVQAEKTFGRVDMYVSNAARRLYQTFFETSTEDWHYYLNQQLTASWHLAKAFTPAMKEAGWGRIVHINGSDGWHGGWTRVPHSVAKGALRTLTKSLASGLGEFGITVNDVNPGYMNTVRSAKTHPRHDADYHARQVGEAIPIRRQPTLEELAWACAFLCSERSGAITGSAIHVDGGRGMIG